MAFKTQEWKCPTRQLWLITIPLLLLLIGLGWVMQKSFSGKQFPSPRRLSASARDTILSVAFSPDGKLLAGGGNYGEVRLWDMTSGRLLRSQENDYADVTSIVFSPDGKLLASASTTEVRIEDARTGKLLRTLLKLQQYNRFSVVAFSPDGKLLATGFLDAVKLWDAQSFKLLWTSKQGDVGWITFSPDSKLLAVSTAYNTVALYDVKTAKPLWTVQTSSIVSPRWGAFAGGWPVAFSPDGKTLANGTSTESIELREVKTGALQQTLTGHRQDTKVSSLAFSSNGKLLASGGEDGTVRLWDPWAGKLVGTLEWQDGTFGSIVSSIAFSPDSKTLASTRIDGPVELWQVE